MKIPLSSPDINADDRAAVLDVLSSSSLSLGPRLPQFEQTIADRVGAKFAVAVNSGTSGLHLCVKAAELSEGDEVITTPFSFVASANCLLFERVTPVFVDIDPVTYNIDPSLIEDAITPRTRAILPVHVFGRPCRLDEILGIAQRNNLTVIEDSCEAIGATFEGKPVGTFGQTGVFAFYPNKQITTGEGGAIVTDDPTVAARCRSWRNQGRRQNAAWLQHDDLGYNYRLSELACALGITQVSRLDAILAARARVAHLYHQALKDVPGLVLPKLSEYRAEISWFVYVVRLADEFTREDRDALMEALRCNGVGCNNYFTPIHLQPFYQRMFGFRPGDFPITEGVADRTIALPFFNNLSETQIDYVCKVLLDSLAGLKRSQSVPVGSVQGL